MIPSLVGSNTHFLIILHFKSKKHLFFFFISSAHFNYLLAIILFSMIYLSLASPNIFLKGLMYLFIKYLLN